MIVKKNHNAAFVDCESSRRETDALTFGMDARPLASESKDRDEHSNCKVMGNISIDNENGTTDSPRKEVQNELSHHPRSWDKDADSSSSDSYDVDKEHSCPVHENSVRVQEFDDCNGSDSGDSSTLRIGATDLFEAETKLVTDKSVLECDLPELEVCYKETDCQILKDICVDEGSPEKDINVIENCKDEKPVHLFPVPPNENDHFKNTEGSSLEYGNGLSASQCGSKEENDGEILVSEGKLDSSLDNSFDKGAAQHFDPEDSIETGGANCGARSKVKTDSSEKLALVDRELPIEEFATRGFFRSFLNSLDGEENNAMSLPDQILSGKAVSESPHVSVAAGNGTTENVEEQSAGSVDKDGNSDECSGENAHEHKNTNSNDSSFIDGQLKFPRNKTLSSPDDVEPNVSKHERRDSGNTSVVNQLQHDEGETSFSAASLITYSGPISLSGSLSHRSDGSTTSVKSFAFPVLQSEWNSSPVRMGKADRRHFRKHKGWRSGLLCCRF